MKLKYISVSIPTDQRRVTRIHIQAPYVPNALLRTSDQDEIFPHCHVRIGSDSGKDYQFKPDIQACVAGTLKVRYRD